jgi:hypothetical protein
LYPVPDNREATDFPARLGAAMCGLPQQARGVAIACNGSNINPVANRENYCIDLWTKALARQRPASAAAIPPAETALKATARQG